jgi:hypothetical protein
MRDGARRIALIAVLSLASRAALSACHPPPVPVIDYVGQFTGCTPSTVSCAVGEPIQFMAKPADPGNPFQPCDQFSWDFGDGGTASVQNPTHTFTSPGTMGVFVQVTNDSGGFEGATRTVPVATTVLPSIVEFKVTPNRVVAGQAIVFSWNTTNTTKGVRIENVHPSSVAPTLQVTIQQSIGTYTYHPPSTMQYTLTAFGDAAFRTSAPITVGVVAPARHRATKH